jgi:hypothetical protein
MFNPSEDDRITWVDAALDAYLDARDPEDKEDMSEFDLKVALLTDLIIHTQAYNLDFEETMSAAWVGYVEAQK